MHSLLKKPNIVFEIIFAVKSEKRETVTDKSSEISFFIKQKRLRNYYLPKSLTEFSLPIRQVLALPLRKAHHTIPCRTSLQADPPGTYKPEASTPHPS